MSFNLGDSVYIIRGPHCGYHGKITHVYPNVSQYDVLFTMGLGDVVAHADMILDGQQPAPIDSNTNQTVAGIKTFTGLTKISFNTCNHKWVSYTGFNECFEYCSICDEKRK